MQHRSGSREDRAARDDNVVSTNTARGTHKKYCEDCEDWEEQTNETTITHMSFTVRIEMRATPVAGRS